MADQPMNTNQASGADNTRTRGKSRNNAPSKPRSGARGVETRNGARGEAHSGARSEEPRSGANGNDHDSAQSSARTLSRSTASVGLNDANSPAATRSLEQAVLQELERYFIDLEGVSASSVYAMVLRTVERPMLEVVLQKTGGNQLKAAEILGINRNTLRKKIQQHRLTPAALADPGAGT